MIANAKLWRATVTRTPIIIIDQIADVPAKIGIYIIYKYIYQCSDNFKYDIIGTVLSNILKYT